MLLNDAMTELGLTPIRDAPKKINIILERIQLKRVRTRVAKAFCVLGIETVDQLQEYSTRTLLGTKGFGRESYRALKLTIAEIGLPPLRED